MKFSTKEKVDFCDYDFLRTEKKTLETVLMFVLLNIYIRWDSLDFYGKLITANKTIRLIKVSSQILIMISGTVFSYLFVETISIIVDLYYDNGVFF